MFHRQCKNRTAASQTVHGGTNRVVYHMATAADLQRQNRAKTRHAEHCPRELAVESRQNKPRDHVEWCHRTRRRLVLETSSRTISAASYRNLGFASMNSTRQH